MTTPCRLLLWAAALLGAAVPVSAQEREATPPRGRVLVLDNERTMTGDVERVGTQYRVRLPVGETWVPGDRVLFLAADLQEAYRLLLRRLNADDADERLKLARWCHGEGLADRALENVRAAVALRPSHAASKRLLESLERAAATKAITPTKSDPKTSDESPPPDVSGDSLTAFATRVQPILMNACASCHAGDRASAFRLLRAYDNTTASRRSVQQNLTAVLAQVNVGQPQASPLLTKAVSAHGDLAKAPLTGKQMTAYKTLEEWVEKTVAASPQLRKTPAPPAPEPKAAPVAKAPPADAPRGDFAQGRPTPMSTGPVDPFDPILFNRERKNP